MAMVSFEECPQGVVSVSGTVLFRGWSEYAYPTKKGGTPT